MRYARFSAVVVALLSVGWAQSVRQTRTFKRNPAIEALGRDAKWVWVPLDAPAVSQPGIQARTAILPPLTWLKPSQDADTVPTTANTNPYAVGSLSLPVAGDTLLANNAGSDVDPVISSDCHYSFFDSLYANGAWLIWDGTNPYFSNYLRPPQSTTPDTLYYLDGGIAERYDIDPCALQGSGNSIYIKGIAAQILNNYNTTPRDCDGSSTSEPSIGNGDGAYTVFFQLLDTMQINYEIDVNNVRLGSYPKDTVASVGVPITQIRIGWNSTGGQCITQNINRLERLAFAYFAAPIEITQPQSYYAVVRYELYIPGVDNIADTLFNLIGPAYPNQNSPCWTSDTNFVGRNMVLGPVYRQSTASWIEPDYWYPQYFIFSDRGYALDFLVFPIVYEAPGSAGGVNCSTTGQVIRSGVQGFGLPYPNPVVSDLNLKVNSPAATTVRLSLMTSDGRVVGSWERPVPAGEGQVSVDVGEVPAGAYILQARTPYGAATFWVTVVK